MHVTACYPICSFPFVCVRGFTRRAAGLMRSAFISLALPQLLEEILAENDAAKLRRNGLSYMFICPAISCTIRTFIRNKCDVLVHASSHLLARFNGSTRLHKSAPQRNTRLSFTDGFSYLFARERVMRRGRLLGGFSVK
jgi:hypothetical protein